MSMTKTAGSDENDPPTRWGQLKLFFSGLHSFISAWVVLLFSVMVTIFAWGFSYESMLRVAETSFKFDTQDIRLSIEKRMQEQEVALWGGVGLYNASTSVTRDEWAAYVGSLRLESFLPGLQGYGYAEIVRGQDRAEHVDRIRREGFPEFDIYPAGEREIYSSIIYLEPFRDRNLRAFGYDMFSEPTRRAAMERARDTGLAAVSGMVTLVQETESDVQRGFLMYLPVYRLGMPISTVEERRAALQGFVYSPFRIKDLMLGILGKENKRVDFRIYDLDGSSNDQLLYDSDNIGVIHTEVNDSPFQSDTRITIGGRPWTLEFRASPEFIPLEDQNQPRYIAVAGALIDILIFLTIYSLTNQRRRALLIAKRMTGKLQLAKEAAEHAAENETLLRTLTQESNNKLKVANDGLLNFTSIAAHDLRAPLKRIESFIEILREDYGGKIDGEGKDILTRIERGSSRMRVMLDSLHDYAKYSDISIKGSTANIANVARNAVEMLDIELEDAQVNIDTGEDCRVQGNAILLEQVLQNLIRNSIKFRGVERPAIQIVARKLDSDKVELTVTDNGIGIEPQFAEKVFDMFARLHNEDEYPGTGIGLAVCKKIILDHDGDIRVDTDWLNGTRMIITLCQVAEQESAMDRALVA
ncbi:MAG: CHASE domain-containing protein [Fimbriimonadaceae bacterium]|nr:CHASE domain-containing protein [Alphaproteobacteria bacterium]